MKKMIYLLGIMLLMAGAAKAQDAKTQSGPSRIPLWLTCRV